MRFHSPAIMACFGLAIALGLVVDVSAQEATPEYKNTKAGVEYVGTEKCVACHQDQHASYLKTTHSVATTLTNLSEEAPSGEFVQEQTGTLYEILRREGQMIHREVLRDTDGKTLAVTEQPIAYTVGSGTHGKSYLYRSGSYLGQSPITWFQDTQSWGMSPGFDRPFHKSFHRTIGTDCVFCHVGSINRLKKNPYKFEIIETTIGCERCHGPGELHVAKHRDLLDSKDDQVGDLDLTIVNPANLSRELGEAICQQCHLQGIAKVDITGEDSWDYRPSLKLSDYRVDYQLGLQGQQMKIVGHVEQLHASACYQQDATLTCITCHNPHNPVAAEARIDFQRQACLKCHENQACGKPLQERETLADNSCYQCHMPKADTNVAHAAFHHHRIGLHSEEKVQVKPTGQLLPIISVAQLSERERQRCEALAKVVLLEESPDGLDYEDFGIEATESLIRLKQTGPVDATCDSQLAFLANSQDQKAIAKSLAQDALQEESLPTMARINAASLLAQLAFQDGDSEQAVKYYRLLANYHRNARDMFFLGLCENNVGNVPAAIEALRASLKIDPAQVGPHTALRAVYQATGQQAKADAEAEMQLRISELTQRWRDQADRP